MMKKSFKLKFDDEKDKEEVSIEDKDIQEETEEKTETPQTRITPSSETAEQPSLGKDTVEVSDEEAFRVGKIVVFSAVGLVVLIALFSTFNKAPKQTTQKDQNRSENISQSVFEQNEIKESQQSTTSSQKYTVKAGDTLYGIATELDIDWQDIAELNDIKPPFTLKTGQELLIPEKPK